MKNIKFVLREIQLPFRFTFAHSRSSRREGANIILEIHHPDGQVGYGETLYRSYLTGESFDSIVEDIKDFKNHLIEFDFLASASPKPFLNELYYRRKNLRNNASFCAFDLAVYDLHAKINNRSIASYFNASRTEKLVTVPIGLNMPIILVVLIASFFGFREFKIKVDDQSLDKTLFALKLLKILRLKFRLDANEAWDDKTIVQALSRIPKSINSIEQPTEPNNFAACYSLVKNKNLKIRWVADESIISLEDAHSLMALDKNIVWNLRFAKNGGITGIQNLMDLANDNSVEYQLGVLVGETGLLASVLAFFSGITNCQHVEYGFNDFFLNHNPFKNPPLPIHGKSRWSDRKSGVFSRRKIDLNRLTTRTVEI